MGSTLSFQKLTDSKRNGEMRQKLSRDFDSDMILSGKEFEFSISQGGRTLEK
jgi:hypothetical protein